MATQWGIPRTVLLKGRETMVWDEEQQQRLPALGLGVEESNHRWRGPQGAWCPQGKAACILRDCKVALGGVGDLQWFGDGGTSNSRGISCKSLGGQERGQRQGGPGCDGRNGTLAKG